MQPMNYLIDREAVGQSPIDVDNKSIEDITKDTPLWINQEVKVTLDVNELLDNDKNPLAEVNKLFRNSEELMI